MRLTNNPNHKNVFQNLLEFLKAISYANHAANSPLTKNHMMAIVIGLKAALRHLIR